jgi:hypothetical protein
MQRYPRPYPAKFGSGSARKMGLKTGVKTTILDDSEQYLRAREAEAMCDHVWIFEARTLSRTSPATMRHVRCIPDGTKVPRTGHRHPNFGLAGRRPEGCSSRVDTQ